MAWMALVPGCGAIYRFCCRQLRRKPSAGEQMSKENNQSAIPKGMDIVADW